MIEQSAGGRHRRRGIPSRWNNERFDNGKHLNTSGQSTIISFVLEMTPELFKSVYEISNTAFAEICAISDGVNERTRVMGR